MTTADIIIIGAGPGGYETAAGAAAAGKDVIIIERSDLGGTCLNRGCIPTKALCRSAEAAQIIGSAAELGIDVSAFSLNYPKAVERKDSVVSALREGVATLLKGVRVVSGEAAFTAAHTVMVNGEEYTAPTVIIATGSRPASLPIPGAELAVNSDFVLSMTSLPTSIAIIGGGVIGMEFASIFASFGVKVTVLEYFPEILPPFDSEIAKRLRMCLKRRGIDVVTSAQVTAITPGEQLNVEYTVKDKPKACAADMVLMAVGRTPVVPAGAVEAGIELTKRGAIAVDENMMTSVPGVYAIGDVNGKCMLAHAATAQGKRVLGAPVCLDVIPSAVFTMPECAMVGLTEDRCKAEGIEYCVGKSTFRANGKAMAMNEPDGLVKVIVSADGSALLGCHICGAHAADLVQEAATVMAAGLAPQTITTAIHGHPTLGEAVAEAVRQALS